MPYRFLAIGPANYAGQAHAWVRAVEQNQGVGGRSFSFDRANWARRRKVLTFPADRRLPHPRLPLGPVRGMLASGVLSGATHVILDGFRAVRTGDDADLPADLTWVASRVIRLGLMAHGSDVRDPAAHRERWGYSYYRECEGTWTRRMEQVSARNRLVAAESGLPVFVSTPDLLLDVPAARWVPVVVDGTRWAAAPWTPSAIPTILHVPSRRHPPIKGTRHVDAAAGALERSGRCRYVSPDGVPVAQMPALVGSSDIVVDQVTTGFYSLATVEALAAGRLVVGNIAPEVRALVPLDIPVVQAEPQELAEVLADVVARPEAYEAMAGAGPGFVRALHDGRRSAEVLGGFLA